MDRYFNASLMRAPMKDRERFHSGFAETNSISARERFSKFIIGYWMSPRCGGRAR
jgi:hypothetical protein